ncbi:MarR family winged helix-turn-helix transcriptional regulator [Nocardioides aurantiacus]|uniref:MarR family winged helix-turn-helix transcriptional regulator n=1 Tax=Nocardioides aurantiacus TaxID=86796 RepID=UPI00403F55B2
MDAPRWLDDEQQAAWRAYLFATQAMQSSLDRQLTQAAGMPHSVYLVLAMLSEAPDRTLSMGVLAEMVRSSPSRLSHAVAKLEWQGWVTRARRPDNARVVVATLTDAGFARVEEVAPLHVEQVRQVFFDRLSEEQVRQLREIFEAVGGPLADETPCPPADCD